MTVLHKKKNPRSRKNAAIARSLTALLACWAVVLGACGPAKSNKTKSAADDGLAVSKSDRPKIDRDVSEQTAESFKQAVAAYEKAAEAGFTETECKQVSAGFQRLADRNPKLIEARYNAGLALQNCGMYKEAEQHYQKVLGLLPSHAESLSNLGQIYFLRGDETRARGYWEKAVTANGQIVGARNNLAWLIIRDMRQNGRVIASEEQAKRHLSSALAVDNDNVEAHVLYALLYMQGSDENKSRLNLARLHLEKAAELDKNFAPLHNADGLMKLRQDRVPAALESFRRAVALDPNFVEARMNVGNIVLQFRKYDDAKTQFDAVLALEGKNYDALIGRGYAERGQGQFDAAEASYKEALKVDGRRPEAYFNLGVLFKDFRAARTEDTQAAQRDYRTSASYFKQAVERTDDKGTKEEATNNIKDCDTNIKSLQEFLKFQSESDKAQ